MTLDPYPKNRSHAKPETSDVKGCGRFARRGIAVVAAGVCLREFLHRKAELLDKRNVSRSWVTIDNRLSECP